jgi:hypothetical protein
MMNSTVEIMDKGINCLLENLGTMETERFISAIIRERFDYTQWRRASFGDLTVEEINLAAAEHDRHHPFQGGKI